MNWDEVWAEGVLPEVEGEPDITDVMGEAIYLAGLRRFRVPSLTALMIVDVEEENWAPSDWQFDIYTNSLADGIQVAKALRRRLHHDVQVTMGPFRLWTQFIDGRGPDGPDEDGVFRITQDYRFTPGRSQYLDTDQES